MRWGEGEVEAEWDWGKIHSCSGCLKAKFGLKHKHLFFSVVSFPVCSPHCVNCLQAGSLWYVAFTLVSCWHCTLQFCPVFKLPCCACKSWWFERRFLQHVWVPCSIWGGFNRKRGDPMGGLDTLKAGEGVEGPGRSPCNTARLEGVMGVDWER